VASIRQEVPQMAEVWPVGWLGLRAELGCSEAWVPSLKLSFRKGYVRKKNKRTNPLLTRTNHGISNGRNNISTRKVHTPDITGKLVINIIDQCSFDVS
jgi:hypothetical protein